MSDEITWHCKECSTPIRDGEGYLFIPFRDRRRYKEDLAAWREHYGELAEKAERGTISGKTWHAAFDRPERAEWLTVHRDCDPDPEAPDYWIAIERVRSYRAVIKWTAHLWGKQWVHDETNWRETLEKVAQP